MQENVFADWLSRMYYPDSVEMGDQGGIVLDLVERKKDKLDEALKSVHNARVGHGGIRKTWLLLNEVYPGHGIKMDAVADFVSTCPTCQKYRLRMVDSLPSPVRVLSDQHRHTFGCMCLLRIKMVLNTFT
jgi:hypothetical protein